MIEKLHKIRDENIDKIKKVRDLAKLEEIRVEALGRKSELTDILRGIAKLPVADRPKVGQEANKVKLGIEAMLEERKDYLLKKDEDKGLEQDGFDISLPAKSAGSGHLHPLSRVMLELEDYFSRMGYMIYESENLTTEYDNFVAVNIPEDHPARGMWDTYWVKGEVKDKGRLCMAPHTTCMQNKILKENKPPYKAVALGRCFRREATDASHEQCFYQIEGVIVDKNLSVAHLKKTLMDMVQFIIGRRVPVRLRPSFFPFVEPGFEVDAQCMKCEGKGCGLCKGTGWMEMLGAGMIHQNVFVEAGYKRHEWTGFAYGPGYDRLTMMRYGITDIRDFWAGEPDFVKQF